MKIEYYPDSDMLSISLARQPYESSGGEDTNDPDVVLHYDAHRRLAEIEISHASKRTDLDEIRRRIGFEEVREPKSSAA